MKNFAVPLLTLQGYGKIFAPGPNGISTECLKEYFLPGTDPAVYNAMCANSALLPTPVGEVLSSALLSQTNNIGIVTESVGATPVLLTFGEFDADFPRAGATGNLQQQEIDFWTNNCGCNVSSYIQPVAATTACCIGLVRCRSMPLIRGCAATAWVVTPDGGCRPRVTSMSHHGFRGEGRVDGRRSVRAIRRPVEPTGRSALA